MASGQLIILAAKLLDLVDPTCRRCGLEGRDHNSILYRSSLMTQRTQIHSFIASSWCLHRSNVYSIWHAGFFVALWTCKRDAQWKWSFYVRVACIENLLWILSSFARVAFCDLIGHLKFFQSRLSLDFELIYFHICPIHNWFSRMKYPQTINID